MQEDYRPSRKSSSATTIAVVVVLIILGAVAFFFMRGEKPTLETLIKPVAVAPIVEPEVAPAPVPMVDYEALERARRSARATASSQ